jgi:hypothetical protein
VRAAAIITDGDVRVPDDAMPYEVLWVLPAGYAGSFQPTYGRVVVMEPALR